MSSADKAEIVARVIDIVKDVDLYTQEREVRNAVLMRPSGLADGQWEFRDGESTHLVATLGDQVLGCLILWPNTEAKDNSVQLMQMAVTTTEQGKGIGNKLIVKAIEVARVKGYAKITLHSRQIAYGFYDKLNFKQVGEPFMEVGIEHRHYHYALKPLVTITDGVHFDTVAREWRFKWSGDNDKKSLAAAQTVLNTFTSQVKAVPGVKSVQRVVCGDCLDFKVITALDAADFGTWAEAQFAPEAAFLAEIGKIDGVHTVETQTYTLMSV